MDTSTFTPPPLGRLEKVPLREYWQNEAYDFTPWLAAPDNVTLLGDAIGIELEVEAQEKAVGPFSADILCRDTATGDWVLIENQLERTDHSHLGQLLTYAAGLSAVTIVWIAQRFTDEHRAALDWLNEHTDEKINFFGLEIELWRIGASAMAPKFNVVCKPNNWTKARGAGSSFEESDAVKETKQRQLEYWTAFKEHLQRQGSTLRTQNPLRQNWFSIALGRVGFRMNAVATTYSWDGMTGKTTDGGVRAEVEFHGNAAKDYYRMLSLADQEQINAEFGEPLTWYDPPSAKLCRIYIQQNTTITDREDWSRQHEWLREKLERLHYIFQPVVERLYATPLPPAS